MNLVGHVHRQRTHRVIRNDRNVIGRATDTDTHFSIADGPVPAAHLMPQPQPHADNDEAEDNADDRACAVQTRELEVRLREVRDECGECACSEIVISPGSDVGYGTASLRIDNRALNYNLNHRLEAISHGSY